MRDVHTSLRARFQTKPLMLFLFASLATLGLSAWAQLVHVALNPYAYLTGVAHGLLFAIIFWVVSNVLAPASPPDSLKLDKETVQCATPRTLLRNISATRTTDLAVVPASVPEAPPTAAANTKIFTLEEYESRKPRSSVRRSARTPKRHEH